MTDTVKPFVPTREQLRVVYREMLKAASRMEVERMAELDVEIARHHDALYAALERGNIVSVTERPPMELPGDEGASSDDDAANISAASLAEVAHQFRRERDEARRMLEEAWDSLAFARQYKGIEARPCPLCTYKDGVFIERCEPHRQNDELRRKLEERAPRAVTLKPCPSCGETINAACSNIWHAGNGWTCPRLRGEECGCTAWGTDPSCRQAMRGTAPSASEAVTGEEAERLTRQLERAFRDEPSDWPPDDLNPALIRQLLQGFLDRRSVRTPAGRVDA